jgi:hypothetical protein
MEWAVEDLPGVPDIVEYKCRINDTVAAHNVIAVCTCDLRRFSASLVIDVLRTHPYVIIGGMLQKNMFYVPPGELLRELERRGARAP